MSRILRLRGISAKGKARIREQGTDWVVLAESDNIACSALSGPWLLIKSTLGMRWIQASNDKDFEIVEDLLHVR